MNRVINSFFGGCFRTLGKFFALCLIGGAIALICLKFDFKLPDFLNFLVVNASETSGYGSAKYIDCSYAIDNRGIVDTDDVRCPDWINFGTEDTYPTNTYRYMYSNNVFITSGNYTWEKGNTYTITMTLAINPKEYDDFYDSFRVGQFRYEGGTTSQTSSLSEDNLIYGSSTIEISNISNNNYWVQYKFTFIPSKSLKSVWFQILYRGAYDGMEASDRGLALRDFQYYRIDSVTYVEGNDLTQVTDAINQQIANDNQNTQDIIDNQNQNTQDIIDNQNQNTQDIIDSNLVCKNYDKNDVEITGKALGVTGNLYDSNNAGVSKYIDVSKVSYIKVLEYYNSGSGICFYQSNKTLISCIANNSVSNGDIISIPQYTYYIRFSINTNSNRPILSICSNGNQAITDSLNSDDTSQATSEASDFFSDFTTNTHGLTGIITAPLNAIESLTSKTCTPLEIPLPYLNNKKLTLPCMRSIYVEHFGGFMTLYDVVTLGIVAYWVIVRIFALVKDFKNPEHDEIEVVDL